MVSGDTHSNLIFDVTVPFEFDMSDKELVNAIQRAVSEYNKAYYVVITIDKNYV